MVKCPECGAEVDAGGKFCMECGAAIPQTKECPKCHAQWPLNVKFCPECGSGFDTAPSGGASGAPLMGDKNVIAGDVNNSVSLNNSNNTTNNTTNNTSNVTTNATTNNVSNVSNVTNNSQVTNNSTTNNTYIRQEIKQETELDKEAKRVQIEKLRLEKEQQEREIARRSVLDDASLETEKTRKAAELAQEKIKLQQIEEEASKSPYSKRTFRRLGLWLGFLGIHYAYVRRWAFFAVTVVLMAGMTLTGKSSGQNAPSAAAPSTAGTVKSETSSESPQKADPVSAALGIALFVLWIGGTFFVTTDAKGRKLK